jgi:hypothetical protein
VTRQSEFRVINLDISLLWLTFEFNAKDSAAVEYPTAGSDGHTLKFFTNFTFLVNHTYYVLMDSD